MADANNTGTEVEAPKKMTKTEARELKGVVKQEYSFLRGEIGGQVAQVKQSIREQLDDESEGMLKAARQRVEKLRKKAVKLEDEARDLLGSLRDEGIDLRAPGYRNENGLFAFTVNSDLKVTSQQKRMEKAMSIVDERQREVSRELTMQENGINRDLVTNMMSSDEGRAFIQSIPSLENLIDVPNLQQITA